MNKFHYLLSTIWFVVCVLGNIYQVAKISALYFQYDMSTTVLVNFPKNFTCPSISFCFSTIDLVVWDKVFKKKPGIRAKMNLTDVSIQELQNRTQNMDIELKIHFEAKFFDGLTGTEIFDLVMDEKDMFPFCMAVDNIEYLRDTGNCSKKFKIRKMISESFICYHFEKIKENSKWTSIVYDLATLNRVTGLKETIYYHAFSQELANRVNQLVVRLNPPPDITRMDQKALLGTGLKGHAFTSSYADFENNFLPAPYATDCINYIDIGFLGKDDCFESCIANYSIKHLKKIYSGPSIYPHTKEEIIPTGILLKDHKFNEFKLNSSKFCDKKCHMLECYQHFYIPRFRTTIEYPISAFVMSQMSEPKLATKFTPTLDFLSFVTDVGSTFGFWMGLSTYTALQAVVEMIGSATSALNKNPGKKTQKKDERSNGPSFQKQVIESLTILVRDIDSVKAKLVKNDHDIASLLQTHLEQPSSNDQTWSPNIKGKARRPRQFMYYY